MGRRESDQRNLKNFSQKTAEAKWPGYSQRGAKVFPLPHTSQSELCVCTIQWRETECLRTPQKTRTQWLHWQHTHPGSSTPDGPPQSTCSVSGNPSSKSPLLQMQTCRKENILKPGDSLLQKRKWSFGKSDSHFLIRHHDRRWLLCLNLLLVPLNLSKCVHILLTEPIL